MSPSPQLTLSHPPASRHTGSRRRSWWAAVALACAIWACPALAHAQRAAGAGVGLYLERGELIGEEQIGPQEPRDESFTFRNSNFLTGSMWILFDAPLGLRIGGGARFYGNWNVRERDQDNSGDNDDPPIGFGKLLEVDSRVEWLLDVTDAVGITFGLHTGLATLFPGGRLRDEIDRLRDQDVSVWRVPRLGLTVMPLVGARWQFLELLAARADIGVRYERLWLFATTDDVSGVAVRKRWAVDTVRYELNLGLEVHF
jgi:hypothetical protein